MNKTLPKIMSYYKALKVTYSFTRGYTVTDGVKKKVIPYDHSVGVEDNKTHAVKFWLDAHGKDWDVTLNDFVGVQLTDSTWVFTVIKNHPKVQTEFHVNFTELANQFLSNVMKNHEYLCDLENIKDIHDSLVREYSDILPNFKEWVKLALEVKRERSKWR